MDLLGSDTSSLRRTDLLHFSIHYGVYEETSPSSLMSVRENEDLMPRKTLNLLHLLRPERISRIAVFSFKRESGVLFEKRSACLIDFFICSTR